MVAATPVATPGPASALGELPGERAAGARSPRGPWARRALVGAIALAAGLVLLVAPPDLGELAEAPALVAGGDPAWLAAALLFEILSFAGYVALFRSVFVDDEESVGWRESYAITMAGLVATRLFATAGAGGIALTAWALRRLGVGARRVAERMVAFLVLLYGVYMACLVLFGLGLWTGLLPGAAPWPLTLVPAALGGLVIVAGLALTRVPGDLDQRLRSRAAGAGTLRRALLRSGDIPAAAGRGTRVAASLLRRRRPGLVGAPAWWGFDIAVLWATFHAFGEPPALAVLVIAYFVGMLGNLLPLPGGVGGVEGGMIGALVAFGVGGGLAVVAVLAYRVFAFWLPMAPGALAYLQLRRRLAAQPQPVVGEQGPHETPPPPVGAQQPHGTLAVGERRSSARLHRAAEAARGVRLALTPRRLAALVAATTLAAAYLAGALPRLPSAEQAVTALGEGLGPWSYVIVGGLALLETAALVGLFAPGEWSAIVGGAVAGEGAIWIVALVLTVWACAAAGHTVSFLAGRRFGRAFLIRHGPRFRLGPERLAWVDAFFARHGAKAVLGGQFVGLVRAVVPFLAGSSGMAYRRFVLPSVLATGVWASAYTLLGYLFYRSLAAVEGMVGLAAAGGSALGFLVVVVALARHNRRNRGAERAGGAPQHSPAADRRGVEVLAVEAGDGARLPADPQCPRPGSRGCRFDAPRPRRCDTKLSPS